MNKIEKIERKIEKLQKELLNLHRFESVAILKDDTDVKSIDDFKNNIKKLVDVEKIDDLGVKPLAYGVKKYNKGYFIDTYFVSKNEDIQKIEKFYRENDDVLKFMTIRSDKE